MRPSSLATAVLALSLAGCGGAAAERAEVRPVHPSCDEACAGHCEDDAETCRARCERECAPAPTGAALVTSFVDAVQASGDPGAPLATVIEERVAWRVYLAALAASALANVSPQEQGTILSGAVDELSRAETAALRRLYVDGWREEIGPVACTVAPSLLEHDPFALAPSLTEEVRTQLAPELARAGEGQTAFEVRCAAGSFVVVVLADGSSVVPLL